MNKLSLHNLSAKIEMDNGEYAEVELSDEIGNDPLQRVAGFLMARTINEQLCANYKGDLVNTLTGVYYKKIKRLTIEFED